MVADKEAETVLDDWVKQVRESKIPQLMRMAAYSLTGEAYWHGMILISQREK